jgi:hypothetical protein
VKEAKLSYYVASDDPFDILHNIYINRGHTERNMVVKEIKIKYSNIIQEIIMTYQSLCN